MLSLWHLSTTWYARGKPSMPSLTNRARSSRMLWGELKNSAAPRQPAEFRAREDHRLLIATRSVVARQHGQQTWDLPELVAARGVRGHHERRTRFDSPLLYHKVPYRCVIFHGKGRPLQFLPDDRDQGGIANQYRVAASQSRQLDGRVGDDLIAGPHGIQGLPHGQSRHRLA